MPIQITDAFSDSVFAQRQTGLLFNLPPPEDGVEQLPEGISLCMIVKNEERFLAECLESVKDVVDEMCIVDTGSTDRTVEIARSYGAKIEFREWRNDFSWARNESLAMATKRWCLVLDGDEEITYVSRPLLRAVRSAPAGNAGIYLNIVNTVNDSMGAGTMSHRLVRMFPNNPRMRYQNVIHEAIGYEGGHMTSVFSPITILHKGYTGEMLETRSKDSRNKPLLAKAYEENGDDPFAMFNFGNSAITSGDHELGIEMLERMIGLGHPPKMYYPLAYIMLAQGYAEGRKDIEKSLEVLERGVELFPRDAGVLFMAGQMYARLARWEEARERYERVMQMRDGMGSSAMTDEEIFEWKAYFAISVTYDREGNREKALEYIEKAVANKPNAPRLYYLLCQLNEALGRYYEAETALRKAVALDPVGAQVELVNFLLRRQRFAQAIAMVEATSDESSAKLVVLLNVAAARAMLLQKAGDPVPFLEAALRRSPGSGSALALMEEVLTARDDREGLARLHAAELEAPLVEAEDYVRRAFRLLALGRAADAWEVVERGLPIAPFDAQLRFNGVLALLRLGRDKDALEHLACIDETATEVFVQAGQMRAALQMRYGNVAGAAHSIGAWVNATDNDVDAILSGAKWLAQSGGRREARELLAKHAERDRRIATELASMLLNDGDIEAAGAIAERALR
jgi:glycosyltransferase involved in cell wall biosynthesis/thioredoxin-like negative regulator of GroEL